MRILKTLFLLFTLCGCLSLFSIKSDEYTSVPLQFSQDMPSMEVEIQGVKVPLILDLGASSIGLTVNQDILDQLKFAETDETLRSQDVTGEKFIDKILSIDDVNINHFRLNSVPLITYKSLWGGNEEGFIETKASKSGVIGVKLIENFKKVFIDYPSQEIVFVKKGSGPKKYDTLNWNSVPFRIDGGITSELEINGQTGTFIWDTGAIPCYFKEKFIQKIPQSDITITERIPLKVLYINHATLNKNPLKPFKVTTLSNDTPFEEDGLIGSSIFKQCIVCFDFEKKMVYYQVQTAIPEENVCTD